MHGGGGHGGGHGGGGHGYGGHYGGWHHGGWGWPYGGWGYGGGCGGFGLGAAALGYGLAAGAPPAREIVYVDRPYPVPVPHPYGGPGQYPIEPTGAPNRMPPPLYTHARALRAYAAHSPPEISLNEGDVVEVLRVEGGWTEVAVEGKKGWVPTAFLEGEKHK